MIVRKNQPPVLPSRARLVRVGDDDAGEIWTTPDGAVTDVRMGIETDEMMPPMIAGTRLISTSCLATSTATVPWLWASRISAARRQPAGPPASFRSRKASSTAFDPAWPNCPAGPVRDITTPIVVVHCAAATLAAGQGRHEGGEGAEAPSGCVVRVMTSSRGHRLTRSHRARYRVARMIRGRPGRDKPRRS